MRMQGGVLARSQAMGVGMGESALDRVLADGSWQVAYPGIYHVGELTFQGRAWAGILLGGRAAVLGRRTAAYLDGLLPVPDQVEVWVGVGHEVKQRPGLRFIGGDRTGRGDPTRTRVPDTILDLAAELSSDDLLSLVADAVAWGRTSERQLRAAVRGRTRIRGGALLREVLGEVSSGFHSPLESRYTRNVEKAHGLPMASRQYRLGGVRCDAYYDPFGLVVELDGSTHFGAKAYDDMSRDNQHALQGLSTLRFGWKHVVGGPCLAARDVAQALAVLGWAGVPRRCTRCRHLDASITPCLRR